MRGRQENTGEVLLKVRNLIKEFKSPGSKAAVHAINDVSFDLYRGETFGLIGESGSGKTTVGRCILRLIEPTRGGVIYKGKDLMKLKGKELRRLRPDMQMVFQDPSNALNPKMNVENTLLDTLNMKEKLSGEKMDKDQIISKALSQVAMEEEYRIKYPAEMSGGYQQRVCIARAICGDPTLVVLDEPTSALDLPVCAGILDLLRKLQEELGIAYIYISHDLSTIKYICHRVAVMYLGEFVEVGTVDQVFNNPLHPYSHALLSSVMVPDPGQKGKTEILRGEIPSPINLPEGCFFHARCPRATPECAKCHPELKDGGEGHLVRCHLLQERNNERRSVYG